MFIVRIPFKSYGVYYGRGSVITDPSAIKLFRNKQGEGKIVRVHNDQKSRDFIEISAAKYSIEYPDSVLIHVGLKSAVTAPNTVESVKAQVVAQAAAQVVKVAPLSRPTTLSK